MVTKAKHIKGCHILTTQLNQNDRKPGKNVAIIGNSIVLAFPGGIRKGAILVKIRYTKGQGFEPPGGASPYKTLLSSLPGPQ